MAGGVADLDVAWLIVMGSVHEHGVCHAWFEHATRGRWEETGHWLASIVIDQSAQVMGDACNHCLCIEKAVKD